MIRARNDVSKSSAEAESLVRLVARLRDRACMKAVARFRALGQFIVVDF